MTPPTVMYSFLLVLVYMSGLVAASEKMFECTIRMLASLPERGQPPIPHQTACKKEQNESYLVLDGDISAFFSKSPYYLKLGQTQLSIPTSLIDGMHLDLNDPQASESILISQKKSRRRDRRTGIWKVLVVRIIDSTGDSPTKNKWALGTDIFYDALNLVSLSLIFVVAILFVCL